MRKRVVASAVLALSSMHLSAQSPKPPATLPTEAGLTFAADAAPKADVLPKADPAKADALPKAAPAVTSETPGAVKTDCAPEGPPLILAATSCFDEPAMWGGMDYMIWYVKGTQLPPLVTIGNPAVGFPAINSAGALGQPGTHVLYGGDRQDFNSLSGVRLTLGGWLDKEHTFGLEASGFLMEHQTTTFRATSDKAGNPALYFPAFNVSAGAERALLISDPLRGFAGDVSVKSGIRMFGTEANSLYNIYRSDNLDLTLLAGFRYVDLTEDTAIHNKTDDLLFNNSTVFDERFATRNQFYGGQLGGRMNWTWEHFSLTATGKLAMGVTHESVNIQGQTTQTGPGAFLPPGPLLGGFYTQRSNIGRQTDNDFGVIPSVDLKLGYWVTPRLQASIGYSFLYWNRVVRPGDQIDRNINLTQSTAFGAGTLIGQSAPSPLFNRSDFYAQAISFGLEYHF
ncbi:BBP7 family outer membrane beta-barrel protein [Zavarzinella formosa]|uniref:BBP7 family outer membrane beta-barrel protein n=1 Tax=Zavarzinella formosa TaxID=360055 RepID=UPI00030F34F5|nr:BBP7 family outer membrane beta-barrel protein [Zavarzinella formosa]